MPRSKKKSLPPPKAQAAARGRRQEAKQPSQPSGERTPTPFPRTMSPRTSSTSAGSSNGDNLHSTVNRPQPQPRPRNQLTDREEDQSASQEDHQDDQNSPRPIGEPVDDWYQEVLEHGTSGSVEPDVPDRQDRSEAPRAERELDQEQHQLLDRSAIQQPPPVPISAFVQNEVNDDQELEHADPDEVANRQERQAPLHSIQDEPTQQSAPHAAEPQQQSESAETTNRTLVILKTMYDKFAQMVLVPPQETPDNRIVLANIIHSYRGLLNNQKVATDLKPLVREEQPAGESMIDNRPDPSHKAGIDVQHLYQTNETLEKLKTIYDRFAQIVKFRGSVLATTQEHRVANERVILDTIIQGCRRLCDNDQAVARTFILLVMANSAAKPLAESHGPLAPPETNRPAGADAPVKLEQPDANGKEPRDTETPNAESASERSLEQSTPDVLNPQLEPNPSVTGADAPDHPDRHISEPIDTESQQPASMPEQSPEPPTPDDLNAKPEAMPEQAADEGDDASNQNEAEPRDSEAQQPAPTPEPSPEPPTPDDLNANPEAVPEQAAEQREPDKGDDASNPNEPEPKATGAQQTEPAPESSAQPESDAASRRQSTIPWETPCVGRHIRHGQPINWLPGADNEHGNFAKRLANAYVANTRHSDIRFILEQDGTVIPAHSLIIGSASQYLQQLCYDQTDQLTQFTQIQVGGIGEDDFIVVLRYLYSSDGLIALTIDNCIAIWLLARNFRLRHLIDSCIGFLDAQLSVANVCQLFSAAWSMDNAFTGRCLLLMREHIDEILDNGSAMQMGEGALTVLLAAFGPRRPHPVRVHRALVRWADGELRRLEVRADGHLRRSMCSERRLAMVRYEEMTLREFGQCLHAMGGDGDGFWGVQEIGEIVQAIVRGMEGKAVVAERVVGCTCGRLEVGGGGAAKKKRKGGAGTQARVGCCYANKYLRLRDAEEVAPEDADERAI